jgi:hypothetical protein
VVGSVGVEYWLAIERMIARVCWTPMLMVSHSRLTKHLTRHLTRQACIHATRYNVMTGRPVGSEDALGQGMGR